MGIRDRPFTNTVYEQADSLKPAADKFKLSIQTSDWISKGGNASPPLNNPKLLTAIFSDDAIKNKRNTEAVEVAPQVLVSAHVIEHEAPQLKPLDSVRGQIEERLKREEAARMAKSAGDAALAQLAKGEAAQVAFGPDRGVSRIAAPNMAPQAVREIFKADVAKLPAYVGTSLPDGSFGIYRISKIEPYVANAKDEGRSQMLRQQYDRLIAEAEFSAWLASLRLRYPMEVNTKALEAKER